MSKKIVPILIGSLTSLAVTVVVLLLGVNLFDSRGYNNQVYLLAYSGVLSLVYFLVFYFFGGLDDERNGFLKFLGDILYLVVTVLVLIFSFLVFVMLIGNDGIDLNGERYAGDSIFAWAMIFVGFSYLLLPIAYLLLRFHAEEPRRFYPYVNLAFYVVDYLLAIIMTAIFMNSSGAGSAVAIIFWLASLVLLLVIHVRNGLPFLFHRSHTSPVSSPYAGTSAPDGQSQVSNHQKPSNEDFRSEKGGKEKLTYRIDYDFKSEVDLMLKTTSMGFWHEYFFERVDVSSSWTWIGELKINITYVVKHTSDADPSFVESTASTCHSYDKRLIEILSKTIASETDKLREHYKDLDQGFRPQVTFDVKFERL